MATDVAMELRINITKRLAHFTLEVACRCAPGQLLAVIGPSGAGKTTLLRIIAGLERPDKGAITYGGEVWADTAAKHFTPPQKRALGYVFQEFSLFPHVSVLQNVGFAARDAACIEAWLRRFDLWHLKDKRPHQLSGGERQRCAICQALAREPKALLLDEPFSALDPLTRRALRACIKELKATQAIPIIHVTHDIHEALYLADDIVPLVEGRINQKWLLQFLLHENPRVGQVFGDGEPEEDEELIFENQVLFKENVL